MRNVSSSDPRAIARTLDRMRTEPTMLNSGTVTLAAGVATVAISSIRTDSRIILHRRSTGSITFTGATWTNATLKITKTGAFTNYTYTSGDTLVITAGTGATPGTYTIASKIDNNNITLTASIGAGADGNTDMAGRFVLVNGDLTYSITEGTSFTITSVKYADSSQTETRDIGTIDWYLVDARTQ